MKNKLALLLATTTLCLTSVAFAAEETDKEKSKIEYKKGGGYEATSSSEQTTPDSTTRTSDSKVDVDVNSRGNAEKTAKTESTTDPKGLMNKKKDDSETKIEEKARGGYRQVTTRKHTDADGTNITYKTTTDVDVDATGNVTTTAVTEKTVDPKGLMNKTKTTTKTKAVNGQVIEQKTDTK